MITKQNSTTIILIILAIVVTFLVAKGTTRDAAIEQLDEFEIIDGLESYGISSLDCEVEGGYTPNRYICGLNYVVSDPETGRIWRATCQCYRLPENAFIGKHL